MARQLGKETLFREYWEAGAKAPDEQAWVQLFEGDAPILILLDEMPPYFHYYNTQSLGQGTVADVITRAFSNMLTAGQKKKNVCIVVSDLEAAYDSGGKLIQRALDDATQEVGRAEVSITPVNLESNEIYEILRKRLFLSLPDPGEISEIASVYASRLAEAAKAKTVERSAEALTNEIESTYPFHPSFITQFFKGIIHKNNVLVLTGDKSSIASVEKAARHVYAVARADHEIAPSHPQRKELDEKKAQYEQDFQTTVLAVFDKLLFPGNIRNEDSLRAKALDSTYPSNEPYNGERQVIKTLISDPIKLYTQIPENFEALRTRAEQLLFGTQEEARKTDLLDKMKQKSQMPWLPAKGFDQLAQEAFQRGLWEDLGNGFITRKPKPKLTEVIVLPDTDPDDRGKVRLKIDTVNAGNSPRIHYQEDGAVSAHSPVLKDNVLVTSALRVQFLAVDPTGKNQTGTPTSWNNKLMLRNCFDAASRTVELRVAPKGKIRYTLDGSEARNGMEYTGPLDIGESTTVYVFAECEGLEEKRQFTFPKSGSKEIKIDPVKPAKLFSSTPKRLDNSAKTYEGLKIAREKNITFEQVTLIVGSSPRVGHLTLGDINLGADFIEKQLSPASLDFARSSRCYAIQKSLCPYRL
ncbi:DUF499 domain-containing protein [Deltaproteobacteria bacterium TL4]